MKAHIGTWLKRGVLAVLAGVFIYAGASKIIAPLELADTIAAYQLPLNGWMVSVIALTLPFLETISGLFLFWRKSRRAALCVLGILSVLFLIALGQAALRGLVVDCGCFGSDAPSYDGMVRAILRDVLLLAAIVALYKHELNHQVRMDSESKVS
ncbi:MAG: hypothetical protein LBV12_12930 [Puniceicoccales bacterium]|nr:hypothetical protein [Puniceicoccales bacterium]